MNSSSQTIPFPVKISLLIIFIFLMACRVPHNPFNGGEIVAEDGTVFLAYAWHAPFWKSLFHPLAGYLNITANGTGIITAWLIKHHIFSLAYAPVLIQCITLLFQTLPLVLILWGKAEWLSSYKSIILSLIFITFCPKSDEVWLHGMHIQYWLALCCGLILILDTQTSIFMWIFKSLILFFAPLSSPLSIILTPLFLLRSYYERSFTRLLQTIILGASGLIQYFIFYYHFSIRSHPFTPSIILNAAMFRGGIIACLTPFSKKIGNIYVYFLTSHNNYIHSFWYVLTLISLCFIITALYAAFHFRKTDACWSILIALFYLIIPYIFGAIITDASEIFSSNIHFRYNFMPMIFIGITFIMIAHHTYNKPLHKYANILIILYSISCIKSYFHPLKLDGPNWRNEAALWEHDHNYTPMVMVFNYGSDLTDEPMRSCKMDANQNKLPPSYCEERWILEENKTTHFLEK